MDVMITSDVSEKLYGTNYRTFEAHCGNKSATLVVSSESLFITVLNASPCRHYGKRFDNFDQALEHYKSRDMKSILNAIRDACKRM